MAIFLKKFETMSQYNAYTADTTNFILPNVSLTVDNNTVHYNPSTPTPSHDYVEIAGIKWATMNVGANSVTDTGLYFQWGDTQGYTADQVGDGEGKKYFDWEDYKYARIETNSGDNGNSSSGSGSTTIIKYNETDGKTVLEASDDAVTAAWGGNWRMPTSDEITLLLESVIGFWDGDYQGSGVPGTVLIDNTDSSKTLFFPSCGYCANGSINYDGEGAYKQGFYWMSSLYSGDIKKAYYSTSSYDDCMHLDTYYARFYGFPVRGVLAEN